MWFALGTLSRWLVFAGLLLMVGSLTFRFFILFRAGTDASELSHPRRSAARTGTLAARLLLLGAAGRLAAQLAIFRDPFEPLVSELRLLVSGTSWGTAWWVQAALGVVALLAFTLAGRGRRRLRALGWTAATLSVLALVGTPAFSGHAYGSERLTVLAVLADTLHVTAGGVWLGSLAVIALVAQAGRRAGRPLTRPVLIGWIAAFSPLALGSAIVIGATGVFASWLHLDAISSLWASSYGRRLALKLGILLVILACGHHNWKKSRGRVEASGDPARLPGTVAVELAAGVLILLVTAILVTTPMPGEGG